MPITLLVAGTVYCQMHYGVDVVAGFLVLGGVAAIRPLLRRKF
jgi:membrane-associated phospholipid phosphatase